jgi:tRNA A-37 threonylcarbamoyl transferase component Bud32/tetratricopeptide (TPR) repeat protein
MQGDTLGANPCRDPFLTGPADRINAALADRYTIERQIGRGGMATVYLARDRKHDRPVAIKVLRPELSAAIGADRFQREITLATRLQHPHILSIYDSGVVDATPTAPPLYWFAMPYVEGEALRARLERERQLPVDDAIRIAHEAARALDHAHRHGVIHRDIKPENILLTADGDTLVADFGIGRALSGMDEGERLTETGVVMGTPAYMSPEQVAGERNLDGRTDVYSLGTVLYEMLAGEPPFTGATAQAIVARRLTEAPRPIRPTRDSVPPELERVVLRSLARAPADRYTAAAFADAMDAARHTPATSPSSQQDTSEVKAPRTRGRWRIGAAVAALLAAVAGAWLVSRRTGAPPPLDDSLVAVAPFDVLDPKLELWREGVVDLLSRNLDGAGPIRSVAPTVVVRRWRGRADRESAAELGRATGAGLVVYGSLLGAGGDSVRFRATLFDVARGRTLEEWELGDEAERVDRLTDSLTLRVLQGLGRTRPIGAVRLAGLGSTNLPAMKAFLHGEQFLRRSEWDSAVGNYLRAIEFDTAFPLALRRASSALGWSRSGYDSLSNAFAIRAGDHNRGLATRDSLLVTADSLMSSLLEAGPLANRADSAWSGRLRRLFATLEHATARYPQDPEVWFLLGEAGNHMGPYAGRPYVEQLAAFDKAIALDSAFAPSYLHPIEQAAVQGPVEMRRYLDAYLALEPHDPYADGLRLVGRILGSTSPSIDTAQLAAVPGTALFVAYNSLNRLADSAQVSLALTRYMAPRWREFPFAGAQFRAIAIARSLMARGHLREGHRALAGLVPAFYAEPALLGAVPAESAAAEFRRQLVGDEIRNVAMALPWWALRRDTVSLRAAAARGDSLTRSAPGWIERAGGRYVAAAAAAYLTLARSDTADAIRRLAALPRDDCPRCYLDRVVLAQLLVEVGRDAEAWGLLQADLPSATLAPFASEVLWSLLRGRVAERIGEREQAIRSYSWVVGMWRRPDPELEPYVTEAREGLERLTAEKR